MRRPAVVVLAAGLALVVLGVLAALASSEPRLAGTNALRAFLQTELPPDQTLCQGPELVFEDTARVRVFAGPVTVDGPALGVRLREGGRTVASGRVEGGYGPGGVAIPLDNTTTGPRTVDAVCIQNRGSEPVALGGDQVPVASGLVLEGRRVGAKLRLEYVRAGSESWFELFPAVVDRFGFARPALLGSWSLYLAAAHVLLCWLAVVRLVRSWERP